MKNRFFKLIVAGVCLFSSVGFLTACDEEPVTPPENNPPEQEQTQETPPAQTTTYTLIFDEDNNPQTTNTTKTIEKTAINNRSTWPTLAEKDGYAGEWVKKSQDGDTITLIANYGDGSAENPYLIGTVQQLENMINSTKSFNEVYTSASYNVTTEANAKRKVVHYNTVDIAYVKDSSSTPSKASWTLLHCVPTNKLHIRLVSDIDVSSFSEASVGGAVSIVFDGAKYDLDGNIIDTYALNKVSASAFSYYYYASKATYSGNMFEMIVDSTFKNLEINLTDTVAGFAFMARDGQTTLENITVNSTESITKGNNSSAFVSHIMSNCDFRFINCTNNADYEGISGSYNGIFVGGYAVYGTSVSFTNCINNGNIVTGGTCGFFFGNSSYKPTNLSVKNCINNGIMIGDQRSHILVPLVDATRNGEDKYNDTNAVVYDTTVEGEFTQNGEFLKLSSTSTVSVSGNDLIISNSSANLTAGTYEITVSRNMLGTQGGGYTKGFSLPLTSVEVDGTTNTITIEDIFYNVVDIEYYRNNISDTLPEMLEWNNIKNSTYKWAKDDSTKCYILDTNNHYTFSGSRMIYTIAVKNAQGEIVEVMALSGLAQ